MSKPLWISHRGYKLEAPENTIEAFRAAASLGFTGLETDLRLTSDGHIVLQHDPHLGRITGDLREVSTLNRSELSRLPLLDHPATRLTFFDDFLAEFPGHSWVFDIKPETGEGVIRALHQLAGCRGLEDLLVAQAKFVTWTPRQEALLLHLFPRAACYARERECWRAGLALLAGVPALMGVRPGRTYAVPPRLGRVDLYEARRLSAYQRQGGKVVAFLPETNAEARAALAAGADEILTNGTIVR